MFKLAFMNLSVMVSHCTQTETVQCENKLFFFLMKQFLFVVDFLEEHPGFCRCPIKTGRGILLIFLNFPKPKFTY